MALTDPLNNDINTFDERLWALSEYFKSEFGSVYDLRYRVLESVGVNLPLAVGLFTINSNATFLETAATWGLSVSDTLLGFLHQPAMSWSMVFASWAYGAMGDLLAVTQYLQSPGQLFDAVRVLVQTACAPSYRAYFDIFQQGFFGNPNTAYAQSEFCYFVGVQNMKHFYQKAGYPTSVQQAIIAYENGQIYKEQLAQRMYLATTADVDQVLGSGWVITAETKRNFAEDTGISLTMTEANEVVKACIQTLNDVSFSSRSALVEAMAGFGEMSENQLLLLDNVLLRYTVTNDAHYDVDTKVVAESGEISFSGTTGNDLIFGNELDNQIFGGAGDDIIQGGEGNDYLDGGQGSDIYVWRINDGNDTINDLAAPGDKNFLVFGELVDLNEITVTRDGMDAVFSYNGGGGVRVQNWFNTTADYQLDSVYFIDSSVTWTKAQINAFLNTGTLLPRGNSQVSASEGQPASLLAFANHENTVTSAWRQSSVASLADSGSATSQATLDMAVAGLQFDGNSAGQICDITSYAAGASANPYAVTTSIGSSLKYYFSEESRKSA